MGKHHGAPAERRATQVRHEEYECKWPISSLRLAGLIRKGGIPPAHRGAVWLYTCGAKAKQAAAPAAYRDILRAHEGESSPAIRQIEKVRVFSRWCSCVTCVLCAGSGSHATAQHTLARGAGIFAPRPCSVLLVRPRCWLLSKCACLCRAFGLCTHTGVT